MADLVQALSQTFDHTAEVVGRVRPEDLDKPTPCPDWDVRALLAHFGGVVVNMGRGAAGEGLLAPDDAFPVGDDLAGRFRAEAERTLAAWKAHGLEGQVDVGAGPMPASVAISVNLVDTSTHTWDLARATGQSVELPMGTIVPRSYPVAARARAGSGSWSLFTPTTERSFGHEMARSPGTSANR